MRSSHQHIFCLLLNRVKVLRPETDYSEARGAIMAPHHRGQHRTAVNVSPPPSPAVWSMPL